MCEFIQSFFFFLLVIYFLFLKQATAEPEPSEQSAEPQRCGPSGGPMAPSGDVRCSSISYNLLTSMMCFQEILNVSVTDAIAIEALSGQYVMVAVLYLGRF